MFNRREPYGQRGATPVKCLCVAAVLLGCVIGPAVAFATTLVGSNVSYRVHDGLTDNEFSTAQPAQTSNNNDPLSIAATAADRGTGGDAAASSALGVLKAASVTGAIGVSVIPNPPFTTSSAHADASASWSDDVPMLAPGQSGSGIAHVVLRVDASIGSLWADGSVTPANQTGGGQAYAGTEFRVNGVSLFSFYALVSQNGNDSRTTTVFNEAAYPGSVASFWTDVAGDHYLDIPFTFGTPLSLYAFSKVYADAGAGNEATGNGSADLANSIYWGGIASITNSNGAPVTDFTAFGATGHDWVESSVPVPEPETYALLFAGLAVTGILARTRRRAPANQQ